MQRHPPQDHHPRKHWVMDLIWLFPLLIFVLLTATATRVSEKQRLLRLLSAWGVDESVLQNPDVQILIQRARDSGFYAALQPPPPHEHPLPNRLSVQDTGFDLIFPQFGDGDMGGGRRLQTTWTLTNVSFQPLEGTLEIYNDEGNLQELMVNGQTASILDFELAVNAVTSFTTSGTGPIKTGWVHIHSSGAPVSGASSFGVFDAADRVVTDVGVGASEVGTEFTIFADSMGDGDTGVAVANPDDETSLDLTFDLYNPDGAMLDTQSRDLGPREHFALFITQLFSEVPGIHEFEGTVVITSAEGPAVAGSGQREDADPPFAGITLRSTGETLTSLPMVGSPQDPDLTRLAFSQVGDGVAGDLVVTTSSILLNNTENEATGLIEFFNSDATPMEVTIEGESGSSFDFALNPRGVVRLATDGTGELQDGWARVSMDQPLSGSAIFSIFDQSAAAAAGHPLTAAPGLVTEVGVNALGLVEGAYILVDTGGVFDTGIALVFPISTTRDDATLNFWLYDTEGIFLKNVERPLGPLEHSAFFVTEFFADVQGLDLEDFQGSLLVTSAFPFAPLALRSAGVKLTSTPALPLTTGFAPVTTLELAQNLAGTSSMLEWKLHQNNRDWSLQKVAISAPDLGLDTEIVQVGERFAYGYSALGEFTRILEFVATGEGSLMFEVVAQRAASDMFGGDQEFIGAEGRLEGTPEGGLSLELTLLSARPFSTNQAGDSDQIYFLPSGLINLPSEAGTVEITTEFTSVSAHPDEEAPIVRRIVQKIEIIEPDEAMANVETVFPPFIRPGILISLAGTNLGDTPTVLFSQPEGDPVSRKGRRNEDGSVEVLVPSSARNGTIQVDNGSGPGNPYHFGMLFAPTFEAGLVAQEGGSTAGPDTTPDFFFSAVQTPEILSTSPRSCAARFLLDHVDVVLEGAEASLEELEVDSEVGSLRAVRPENDRFGLAIRPIIVESATENLARIMQEP